MNPRNHRAALLFWAGIFFVPGPGAIFAEDAVALVRHAPALHGMIGGSIQQLLGENVTLSGGAIVTGDLLVPGMPEIRFNGNPIFGGTLDGVGGALPSNYWVTLDDNAAVRNVVRRTDAVPLPALIAPLAPNGTRSVVLNGPSQSPGDFASLRNLMLYGNAAGQVAVPPGSYGDFRVYGNGSLTLGVAGASQSAAYFFQSLMLIGQAQIQIVGPVIVTVGGSIATDGTIGSPLHPSWLTLNIPAGGLTLYGGGSLHGYVAAPDGAVVINANSQLMGGVASDRLTVSGGGVLRLLARTQNQPPQVSIAFPASGAIFFAPASFTLLATAADPDGTVARVEFYHGPAKLGETTAAPHQWPLAGLAAGNHDFSARAIDNLGASTDSTTVRISVVGNQMPSVSITAPPNNTTLAAPASFTVGATAGDIDGTITRVEFFQGSAKIAEDLFPPYEAMVAGLAAGVHVFGARAHDNLGGSADSAPITITVRMANQPPSVVLVTPSPGAEFMAPASFTLGAAASDSDGGITRVEFHQGTTKLGEDFSPPYEFVVSGLSAGNYVFSARAFDTSGATTTSPVVNVNVRGSNQPPVVALISPADGAVFTGPATILLSASVDDSDGTVTKVEFFQGVGKIGEVASAPFDFTWPGVAPGVYLLSARAHDNSGASAATATHRVTVTPGLPYFTGFEATEGYTPGPLGGQAGWTAGNAATIVDTASFRGANSVQLGTGALPAQAAIGFPANGGPTTAFIDLFGRPAAGGTPASSIVVEVNTARVALIQSGSTGELNVFDGNGAGGGAWRATGCKVLLDDRGQAVAWLRLTLRGDFATKRWDLYADGRAVACELGFADNTAASLSHFALTGQAAVSSVFDDFYAGFDNPLFVDADRDGMDDGWEIVHGLDGTENDRNGDGDADGLTNVREFFLGLRPDRRSTFDDGIPDGTRVAHNLSLTGPTFDKTAPSRPAGLMANAAGSMVTLTWAPSSDNIGVAGYLIFRNGAMLTAGIVPGAAHVDSVPAPGATYEYAVRAIDLAGNFSPLSEAVPVGVPASGGNGIPDEWQLRYFGRLGVDANGDDDGDGLSNFREFQIGSHPGDFYNGVIPTLLSSDGGLPSPEGVLTLRVLKPDGTPWANAPVTFRITEGYSRLSATPGGPGFHADVNVRTDSTGFAHAYLETLP